MSEHDAAALMRQLYTTAGVTAWSLRIQVRNALIANGLDHDDHVIAYIAKRMVERDHASLLDEVDKLKARARDAIGGAR